VIDNNKIVNILRSITDPQSGNDIISMKLVQNLKINDNTISFSVNTVGVDEKGKFQLHENIHTQIQEAYPQAKLDIHFTNEKGATRPLSQITNIIAVASGKGGVGKSTVSTNLALALKKMGAKVGLIDADLYGPSIPTMLNISDKKPKIKQLYGRHRILPIEQYGLHTISIGNLVEPQQAVVLRGPRLGGIIKQFINEVIWPELDYLIIRDAVKAMNMFRLESINVPIVGVVENMSWFIPDDMPDKKYPIFGEGGGKELAKMSKSVLLAQLPLIADIRKAGDGGSPIVMSDGHPAQEYYLEMAKKTVQQVNVRNELLPPSQVVGMNVQK